MTRSVAVVGGGIGGLTAAVALRRSGWDVDLFERERAFPGTGTALGIWPSATAALDQIEIGDEIREHGTPQTAAVFLRMDGSRIGALDVEGLRRETGDPVYLLSRPALLDALGGGRPRFGEPITDVAALRSNYDLVIGADGIFSRTRHELFDGRYPARYTGITAWRGTIDDRPVDGLIETWGRAAKFGITPQEGGRTNWYAVTAAPERAFAPGEELPRLHAVFGSWKGPVAGVLPLITESGILHHDLYVVPKLPTYVVGNVALIGDAAHAMPPDLGRGACEAIVDAIALTRAVNQTPSIEDGLALFDRRRRPVTQRLASVATAASRLAGWRRALWLRDSILRTGLRLPLPS